MTNRCCSRRAPGSAVRTTTTTRRPPTIRRGSLIPVTEQGRSMARRPACSITAAGSAARRRPSRIRTPTAATSTSLVSVSYVTGAHAFKFGFSDTIVLRDESLERQRSTTSATASTTACPNQITQRTTPYQKSQRQPAGIGLFAQDKWTLEPPDAQPRAAVRLPQHLHSRAAPRSGAARARRATSTCPRPIWRTGRTSRRGWRRPTICSATARPRSR